MFPQSLFCFILAACVAPHTTSQAYYSFCPPCALLSLLLSVHILLLACACGVLQPSHLSYYLTDKYVIVFFIYVYIFTNYSFIIFIYHHKPYISPNQKFVILYLLVFNHFLLSVEYTVLYYSYSLFIFTSRMSSRKGSFLVMSVCTIDCLSSSPASAKAAPHVC